jgi:hypothetical protein
MKRTYTCQAIWIALLAGLGCKTEPARAPSVIELPTQVDSPKAASAPPPERPVLGLSGRYQANHEVMEVCDAPDGCTAEVTDSLVLETNADRAKARIELVQTNLHTCNWEGELRRGADPNRWESVEPDCSVSVIVERDTLRLESDGCRDYCGARAYLSAEFPRSSRTDDLGASRQ